MLDGTPIFWVDHLEWAAHEANQIEQLGPDVKPKQPLGTLQLEGAKHPDNDNR